MTLRAVQCWGSATEPHARCEAVTASGRHWRHGTDWQTLQCTAQTEPWCISTMLLMTAVLIMDANV